MFKSQSIVVKLNLVIIGIIFLGSLLLAAGIGLNNYYQALNNLHRDAKSIAKLSELSLSKALWDLDPLAVEEISNAILVDHRVAAVQVGDKTKTIDVLGISEKYQGRFDQNQLNKYLVVSREIRAYDEDLGTIDIYISKAPAYEQFWNSTVIVVVASLTFSVILGILITLIGNLLIKKPVQRLINDAHTIAQGDLSSDISIDRDDELGQLARHFSIMQESIKSKIEIINQQNEVLEAKVIMRTRQLEEESEKIKIIFDALEEGIFRIERDHRINSDVSRGLKEILNLNQDGTWNVNSILLEQSNLDDESKSQILSVIDTSLGEDVLSFEVNSGLLPKRLGYYKGHRFRILDLRWRPVIIDGTVDSIVVTVRDMTDMLALDRKVEQNSKRLEILTEIIDENHSRCARLIEQMKKYFDSTSYLNESERSDLKAALHTFKGNARSFGMKLLSTSIHRAEDLLKDDIDTEQIVSHFGVLRELIDDYQDCLNRISGSDNQVKELAQSIGQVREHIMAKRYDVAEQQLKGLYDQVYKVDLVEHIAEFTSEMVSKLAKDFDQKAPDLFVSGDNFLIDVDTGSLLDDCLIHLLTNSLDHGLRGFEQRERAKIFISVKKNLGFIQLRYRDNGRGVCLKQLSEIFSEPLPLSGAREELQGFLYRSLFSAGLSTAKEITQHSGRGVGLSSVEGIIQKLGGTIEVDFMNESLNPNQHHQIRFQISIPMAQLSLAS